MQIMYNKLFALLALPFQGQTSRVSHGEHRLPAPPLKHPSNGAAESVSRRNVFASTLNRYFIRCFHGDVPSLRLRKVHWSRYRPLTSILEWNSRGPGLIARHWKEVRLLLLRQPSTHERNINLKMNTNQWRDWWGGCTRMYDPTDELGLNQSTLSRRSFKLHYLTPHHVREIEGSRWIERIYGATLWCAVVHAETILYKS